MNGTINNKKPTQQSNSPLSKKENSSITKSPNKTITRASEKDTKPQFDFKQTGIHDRELLIEVNLLPLENDPTAAGKNLLQLGHIFEFDANKSKKAFEYYFEAADTENNPLACIHLALYYQHGEGILAANQRQLSIKEALTYKPKELSITDIKNAAYYFSKAIFHEQNSEARDVYKQLYNNFRQDYCETHFIDIEKHLLENLPEANQCSMDLFHEHLSSAQDSEGRDHVIGVINGVLKDCTIEVLFSSLKYCLDTRKMDLKLTLGKLITILIIRKKPNINTTNELVIFIKLTTGEITKRSNKQECGEINEISKIVSQYRGSIELLRASICRPHKLELASELLKHSQTQYEDLVIFLQNWIPSVADPLKIQERITASKKVNYTLTDSELLNLINSHLDSINYSSIPRENIESALNYLCYCLRNSKNKETVFLKIISIIENKELMNRINIKITDLEKTYMYVYYAQLCNVLLGSKSINNHLQLINSLNLKNLYHTFLEQNPSHFPEVARIKYNELVQLAFVFAYEGANAAIPTAAACQRVAALLAYPEKILWIFPKEFKDLDGTKRAELIGKYNQKGKQIESKTQKK